MHHSSLHFYKQEAQKLVLGPFTYEGPSSVLEFSHHTDITWLPLDVSVCVFPLPLSGTRQVSCVLHSSLYIQRNRFLGHSLMKVFLVTLGMGGIRKHSHMSGRKRLTFGDFLGHSHFTDGGLSWGLCHLKTKNVLLNHQKPSFSIACKCEIILSFLKI